MTAKKIVNNIVNPLELLTLNINKFTNDHSSKIDGNIRSDYNIFTILIKNFKYMQKSIIDNEESLKQQIVQKTENYYKNNETVTIPSSF